MPKPIRSSMKKANFEAWKSDNSVWSIQEDMLRASIPLMKAVEKVQTTEGAEEIKSLLASSLRFSHSKGICFQTQTSWPFHQRWLPPRCHPIYELCSRG